MWKGIVGKSFAPEEFAEYVRRLTWEEWMPDFIVLHNIEQRTQPGGLSEDYIRDMEKEYRAKGWSAGPHLFVDSEKIWVFSPLTVPGVHANSWNKRTLGVEMEGDYRTGREPFDSGRGLLVQQNAVAAVAILSRSLGLDPETMMLHKENGETEHDCPGANVDKAAFIQAVMAYLAREPVIARAAVDSTEVPQGESAMSYKVIATTLNVRSGPGTSYEDLGDVTAGEIITPVDATGWIPVLLEDNTIGWLALQYLQPVAPEQPQAPAQPEVPKAGGPTPEAPSEYDFSTKEGTIAAIRAECEKQGLSLPEQIAYVLATTDWETGHTLKPIPERGTDSYFTRYDGRRDLGNVQPGDGLRFKGRGFVQITGRNNYQAYTKILGVDLVNNPDLALDPKIALFILVHGFRTGTFTGKKLTDYINSDEADFVNARRCINGTDRAQEITALAEKYLEELA